jgi:hypothetical protein
MSEKAPRRGRISAGRKARALWEDPPAELLFKVVTTETQLDINVDKLLLKHGASLASLPSAGRSPEPSAWATMLISFGGLAFAGHRRVLEPHGAVSLVSRGVISTRRIGRLRQIDARTNQTRVNGGHDPDRDLSRRTRGDQIDAALDAELRRTLGFTSNTSLDHPRSF